MYARLPARRSREPRIEATTNGGLGENIRNGALVFVLVLLMASSFWLVGRWLEPRLIRPESERT
jgi:hypothetical protein